MSRQKRDEDLIKDLKSEFSIDAGHITGSEESFYKHAPDGITKESVTAHNDYSTLYIGSAVEAAGCIAVEAMHKDKKLGEVTATVSLGSLGQMNLTTTREKQTMPPGRKEEVTIKGGTKFDIDFVAGHNSGLLKAARAAIRELGEEQL